MLVKRRPAVDPEILKPESELPTVPEAFRRSEYEGWLEEAVKTFQLKRYQKTQAERLAVLRQINQIQNECLALARNEANWQHFRQEDRLRQKRLDLDELELDQRMEDVRYERERKVRERARAAAAPPSPKRRSLVEEITSQVEDAIRAEVEIKEVFDRARKEHPHLASWLNEWEAKVSWDLKERKWS
jgi:hypothetical protein